MKTSRKILSMFLSLLMLLPIISLAGITASAASPTWKLNTVTNLTETNAKISSRITFSGKIACTEGGFYIGTSKDNMHKNAYPDKVSIKSSYIDSSFLMSKYKETLTPNTKYYYKIYVVASGKTYASPVGSFTTKPSGSEKWTLNTVTNISSSDAKISSRVTFPSTKTLTEGGFYIGTSKDNMHKNAYPDKNCNIKSTYFDSSFLMSKYKEVLTADQEYCYQIYVVVNGTTYKSEIGTFKTSKNSSGKFTLTYNANGGSGAPAAQTGGNAYTISSTIPTRGGYTFVGWSVRSNASESEYNVGDKILIGANTTLYAVWRSNGKKLQSSDIYGFSNAPSNFHTDKYHVTNADFKKLMSYVEIMYGKDAAGSTISSLKSFRARGWEGSCYGMATTTILDKNGQIAFNENFDSSAKAMHDVSVPKTRESVESAINYYHLSQKIGMLRSYMAYKSDAGWSAQLHNLVNAAKNNDMVLFCYLFNRGGHAIVVKDYRQNPDGSHTLVAYDNRYPSRDTNIVIDKSYKTCVVDGTEIATAVEFLTDFSRFDLIDIDGPNNNFTNMNAAVLDSSKMDQNTMLLIKLDGEMTVENADAKSVTISSDGKVDGSMPIYSVSIILEDEDNEDVSTPFLLVETDDSYFFNFFSDNQNYDVSVCSSASYSSVTANGADSVTISTSEGAYIFGQGKITYDVTMYSPNSDEEKDTIGLCGTSKDGVSITYYHEESTGYNGLNILGKQEAPIALTAYGDDNKQYSLDAGYNDILVCTNGTADGELDARVSVREAGAYDVSLLRTTVFSVADMSVQYKQNGRPSITLTPESSKIESITFMSSNDSVTINEDGTLYGAKRGKATVICVATCNGETLETNFSVTVKYTWWQWLIVIFLFGWIWY